MIRIGPARNTPARGIAAILSCAGCAMMMFGVFMTFVGIIVTATADSQKLPDSFDDEFWDDTRRRREESAETQRAAGTAVLIIGILLLVGGIIACLCMCKKANEYTRNQPAQQTVITGPVVTGTVPMGQVNPPPAGYGQPGYPTGAQYPPPATQYPAAGPPQYPPQAGTYPAPPPAGGQYPAQAGTYAPPAGGQYPPPTNPAYPPQNYDSSALPSAPLMGPESAPPPPYNVAMEQKH